MFGFGRHTCPGKELAKLEIIVFLEAFLAEFNYHVVEDQVSQDNDKKNRTSDALGTYVQLGKRKYWKSWM